MNNQFRIFYKKGQALRYTATLDMHKIWERWMRRAEIPLAYSQGFHPQPKMNQAAPLPLGMLSDGEIIDIWVDEICDLDIFVQKLNATPQPGITIITISHIQVKEPAIQTQVHHIEYRVESLQDNLDPHIKLAIETLLNSESIIRVRRRKEYNLRPLILELSVQNDPTTGMDWMKMLLLSLPGKTGRPDEVINALGLEPTDFRYKRNKIYLSNIDQPV